VIRLDASSADFDAAFTALVNARREPDEDVARNVSHIIRRVRDEGDAALKDLTRLFDRHDLDTTGWHIDRADCLQAFEQLAPDLRDALELAAERIAAYHIKQIPEDRDETDAQGIRLGARWRPVDAAGIYVPGGRAA
jgi:histidinol dehydrogenase